MNIVYILKKWRSGEVIGLRGINTVNISRHIRRYLEEKNSCCTQCGWNQIHQITGVVPLEIDHIDGNHLNNKEKIYKWFAPTVIP